MVEFKIKVHKEQRMAYIPKAIIDALGLEWKIVPDAKAAVAFPISADLRFVKKSVELILKELELMTELSPNVQFKTMQAHRADEAQP